MVWTLAALLLGFCLFALLWALARSKQRPEMSDNADIEFYHAQLGEIRRQSEAGLIAPLEEKSATAEAARRLLAASGQIPSKPVSSETMPSKDTDSQNNRPIRLATLFMLVVIPAISLPVYAWLGSPDQPAMALADREKPDPRLVQIADFAAQIEERLAQNPDDSRGLELIAPLYLRLGRAEEAAKTLSRLIHIAGSTAEREANLGEALVAANNGIVGPEAKTAFGRAIAIEPEFQKAQFYLGRAASQAGDNLTARQILDRLLAGAPAEGPIRDLIEREIAGLGKSGDTPAANKPKTPSDAKVP